MVESPRLVERAKVTGTEGKHGKVMRKVRRSKVVLCFNKADVFTSRQLQ